MDGDSREVLPPDTVIATTMAGGIAYYSGLVTIDQLGLTDREVARHGVLTQPVRRGHTKRASTAYLSSRGVNLVIHHPRVFSCREPRTKGPGAHVFIRIEGDDCLRTLYLTPTPALSRLFCSQPENLRASGASPARPQAPSADPRVDRASGGRRRGVGGGEVERSRPAGRPLPRRHKLEFRHAIAKRGTASHSP